MDQVIFSLQNIFKNYEGLTQIIWMYEIIDILFSCENLKLLDDAICILEYF